MHFAPNNLNTDISSLKVNEVEKYIKYFLVCAFCSELAVTGKSGIINQCFSLLKELKLQKPIFVEDASSKIADKVFKFSYSDAAKIWSNLCASKDVFNTNEDARTGTILNFRNVKVVLGKENVTFRIGQPKSKQLMHVSAEMDLYYIQLLFIFRLRLRFIESNQVYLCCVLIGT